MKWYRRWRERRRNPKGTIGSQRVTEMSEESWYPDLEQQGSPWADQRARFLKQRNEGRITMGQYHSAMDISRLTEAEIITQQQAVVRFQGLFPLKELP